MIDFDDFNSHHSLSAMKTLFNVLCEVVGAPEWYRSTLETSFDRMYLKQPGGYKQWVGTLPSGHRGTTFINSVLNAAYLRCAIGGPRFDAMLTLHTGDDVYLRVDTLEECKRILDRTREIGCRINPAKQSVGFVSAEFLRMAITEDEVLGYLPRAIASFSNGNWTGDDPLDPASLLRCALVSTRSMIARSGQDEYGRLVAPALRQRIPCATRTVIDIISGRASLDQGPVFTRTGRFKTYAVEGGSPGKLPTDRRWPTQATSAYLANHVAPIEVEAVERTGVNVGTLMTASSYSKGHTSVPTLRQSDFRIRYLGYSAPGGVALASDLLTRGSEHGVLNKYPLLNMVKGQLTREDVVELLLMDGYQPGSDPFVTAFGEEPSAKNFTQCLSYADAASLGKRTKSGTILVQTPVYV